MPADANQKHDELLLSSQRVFTPAGDARRLFALRLGGSPKFWTTIPVPVRTWAGWRSCLGVSIRMFISMNRTHRVGGVCHRYRRGGSGGGDACGGYAAR